MARRLADYWREDLPALVNDLEHRDVPRPVTLVGHSVGGLMACHLAAVRPDLFNAAASISAPGKMQFAPVMQFVKLLPLLRETPFLGRLFDLVPFPLDSFGRFTAAVVSLGGEPLMPEKPKPWFPGSMEREVIVERVTAGFNATGLGVVTDLAHWSNSGRLKIDGVTDDLLAQLRQVRIPVLLVSSTDDAVVGPRSALSPRALPNAPVETLIVDRMGHCDIILGRDAPQKIWKPLTSWLDRHSILTLTCISSAAIICMVGG